MKKILISLCFSSLIFSAAAQQTDTSGGKNKVTESNLPIAIQTAFKNAYPNTSDVDWKMKEGKYMAYFKVSGTKQIALFNSAGTMESMGVEISKDSLPSAVKSAMQVAYANSRIDEVYKVTEGANINYLMALDGRPDRKILYSSDGKLLRDKIDDR